MNPSLFRLGLCLLGLLLSLSSLSAAGPGKKLSLTKTDKAIDTDPPCGICPVCVNLTQSDTLEISFETDEPVSSLKVRARIVQGQSSWIIPGSNMTLVPQNAPGKSFTYVLIIPAQTLTGIPGSATLMLDYWGLDNQLVPPGPNTLATPNWHVFQMGYLCLSYDCAANPMPGNCACTQPCSAWGVQAGILNPAGNGPANPESVGPFGTLLGNKQVALTYYRNKGRLHYQAELHLGQRAFAATYESQDPATGRPITVTDTFRLTQISVVPLQFRVPFGRIASAGVGGDLAYVLRATEGGTVVVGNGRAGSAYERLEPGIFSDLRIGNPGKGLNIGARVHARWGGIRGITDDPYGFWQIYAQYLF